MNLQFNNGFAEKLVESDTWSLKVSAFTDTLKTANQIFESNIQKDVLQAPEVNINSKQIVKVSDTVYNFSTTYINSNSLKTISTTDSYMLHQISGFNLNETETHVTIRLIRKSLNESSIFSSNQLEEKGVIGGLDVMERLITQRSDIEKFGIIAGTAVGVLALVSSPFFSLEWAVTMPAAVMFFSLPAFILLKKRLREEHN